MDLSFDVEASAASDGQVFFRPGEVSAVVLHELKEEITETAGKVPQDLTFCTIQDFHFCTRNVTQVP